MTDNEIIEKFKQNFIRSNADVTINNGELSCQGNVNYMPNADIKAKGRLPVNFYQVKGNFIVYEGNLKTLQGCPKIVGGNFNCSRNNFVNLLHAPQQIYANFNCTHVNLKSLIGIPKIVQGQIFLTYSEQLPMLPILEVKSCTGITFFDDFRKIVHAPLSVIFKKYLGTGTQGMLACAEEMIEAGYGSNARYD